MSTTLPAIKPISERLVIGTAADAVEYISLFMYGDPGAGKTRLASTAQDHEDTSPVLFLDIDGGTTTFRKRRDIGVIKVRDLASLVKIHEELEIDAGGYKTVVLDSLSELNKLDLRAIMKHAKATSSNPDKIDIDVPSPREWGKVSEHMRTIVRAYKNLPMHSIFTAHMHAEHENAKDQEGPILIRPELQPKKMKTQLPGFTDIVGYLYTEEKGANVTRRMQFAKTKKVLAKDRFDCLGDVMDNPTIPLIWMKILDDHDK